MTPLWLAYALLLLIGQRDGQRAEYLADEIAATVAGTEATAGMFDAFLTLHDVHRTMRMSRGDGGDPASWRATASRVEAGTRDRMPLLRHRSVRDGASLLASHPPTGLRIGRVGKRPYCAPAVVLTPDEATQIDVELSDWYRRLRVRIADTANR